MAGSGAKFVFEAGVLKRNVDLLPVKINGLLTETTNYYAAFGEAYMKKNAKWRDRTGNARNSLQTMAVNEGNRHGIIIAHGMSYGIWLEVRFAGRYAIILPTLDALRPLIMKSLTKGLSRL